MDLSSSLMQIPAPRVPHTRGAASSSIACLKSNLGISTRILHPEKSVQDPNLAVSPPIYQTATFQQLGATEFGKYDYTRSGNPTRDLLEEQIAALDGGVSGYAFASGIAALEACFELLKAGDTVLAGDDVYGGTSRLLEHILPKHGINIAYNDFSDLEVVEESLKLGNIKMVMLESPTNPRMQVCDIRAVSKMAHDAGALVVVDNSVLAPTFCQPLDLGADICMTSSTKFISGHSDVSGGLLTVTDKALGDQIYFIQNAMGLHLGPFDCWLTLRGLKTMSLRMEKQASNCEKLVEYLSSQPLVKKINYPGSKNHPGYDVHASQSSSGGSLVSFTTGNLEASKIIVEESKLFLITVSFGSVTSSISLPCFMSHASMSPELRAARGLPDDLVRISTGIEAAEDLIADLDQAFEKANKMVLSQNGARQ